ncbi:Phosphatidylglycerophosphatase A [hydrothermal vent metagenome]|uniref:Phosphatidylglycerophosphatase A n=1 Tax=hydrothermal vent metagenome TaxID=652676 RepID=A0A3B1BQW6_9ZZZZ
MRPTASRLCAKLLINPIHFLSLGFGSGLFPRAPGTAGTVAAIPVYLLMAQLQLPVYLGLTFLMFGLGIYLCAETSRELGGSDHPAIVWDEIVGFCITMIAVPVKFEWVLAGFLLFRFFDILKPWPIRVLDRRIKGGLGIMLDDVLAGFFAALVLHFIVMPFMQGSL